MTPAERRRVVRVLREAARIVADGNCGWHVDGCCVAIVSASRGCGYGSHWAGLIAEAEFYSAYKQRRERMFYWPRTERYRPVRVIALLLLAAAVEAGDWP